MPRAQLFPSFAQGLLTGLCPAASHAGPSAQPTGRMLLHDECWEPHLLSPAQEGPEIGHLQNLKASPAL